MSEKDLSFRRNLLRYYNVLVEFQGDPPANVQLPIKEKGETFAQWRKRVLGEGVHDLLVFRPVVVNGSTRMARLGEEGLRLKEVVREIAGRERERTESRVAEVLEEAEVEKRRAKETAKQKITKAKNLAKQEIAQEKERVLRRAEQVPVEELEDILMSSDPLDPATQEFLCRLVVKARTQPSPLGYVLTELVRNHDLAVAATRKPKNV